MYFYILELPFLNFFKNDLSCWSVILLFQVSRLSASKEFLPTRIRLMKGQLSTLTTRVNDCWITAECNQDKVPILNFELRSCPTLAPISVLRRFLRPSGKFDDLTINNKLSYFKWQNEWIYESLCLFSAKVATQNCIKVTLRDRLMVEYRLDYRLDKNKPKSENLRHVPMHFSKRNVLLYFS